MAKPIDKWMPFFVGDYLGDTGRLTTEHHGAYLLLLLDYWRNGPPPADDETLAAITKLPLPRWRKLRPAIAVFFTVDEQGRWRQKRADAERARAGEIVGKRSVAGKAGAAARWGVADGKTDGKTDGKRMANAMANGSQSQWQTDGPSPSPSTREYNPSIQSRPSRTRVADGSNASCATCRPLSEGEAFFNKLLAASPPADKARVKSEFSEWRRTRNDPAQAAHWRARGVPEGSADSPSVGTGKAS